LLVGSAAETVYKIFAINGFDISMEVVRKIIKIGVAGAAMFLGFSRPLLREGMAGGGV
jgi:hypothetical protein